MSHLGKLIERATDTNLDLENNKIGKYTITPQHGSDINVYHIYKDVFSRQFHDHKEHISTVTIDFEKVHIDNNSNGTSLDALNIHTTIRELYGDIKEIQQSGFYLIVSKVKIIGGNPNNIGKKATVVKHYPNRGRRSPQRVLIELESRELLYDIYNVELL